MIMGNGPGRSFRGEDGEGKAAFVSQAVGSQISDLILSTKGELSASLEEGLNGGYDVPLKSKATCSLLPLETGTRMQKEAISRVLVSYAAARDRSGSVVYVFMDTLTVEREGSKR